MLSRDSFSRAQRTLAVSGLLSLAGLVLPAAAQPTGERALLNKGEPGFVAKAGVADQEAGGRTVDGARALLNRAGAGAAPVVETTVARRSAPGLTQGVDGRRALLGTLDSATRTSTTPQH